MRIRGRFGIEDLGVGRKSQIGSEIGNNEDLFIRFNLQLNHNKRAKRIVVLNLAALNVNSRKQHMAMTGGFGDTEIHFIR